MWRARENAVSDAVVHQLSDLVKKIALKDKIEECRELAEDVEESLYGGLAKGNARAEGSRGEEGAVCGTDWGEYAVDPGGDLFVTNPKDADELQQPEYRQRVAESLYAGVARYAKAINGVKRPAPTERASIASGAGR